MRQKAMVRFLAVPVVMAVLLSSSPGFAYAEGEETPEQLVQEAFLAVGEAPLNNTEVPANTTVENAAEVSINAAEATATFQYEGGYVEATAQDTEDSVVVERPAGAQIATVLRDGESTARFELEMSAEQRLVPVDEGFGIYASDGSIVGGIAPPWAVDATGKQLPTHYELEDDVIVQQVNVEGAVYPIVADPSVTIGTNIYLWLRGWELASLYAAGATGIAAFMCAVYGTLHPVMCALVAASAAGLAVAVGYFYLQNPPANCRFVIAIRPWGTINYMERLAGDGCTAYRYELPG